MSTQGLPTIRAWKIRRSGAGLTIHGSIDGRIGKLAATDVICADGAMHVMLDADCIAVLSTEPPAAAAKAA